MFSQPLRFIQGVLLFLPTTFLLPNATLAVVAGLSVLVYKPSIRKEDWLYFLFAAGVTINAMLGFVIEGHLPKSLLENNGLLGGVIMLLTYLTARSVDDTVWRWVLLFIIIEAAAVYFQFFTDIRWFFEAQRPLFESEFQITQDVSAGTDLYFIRPLGLSDASSMVGAKLLLGVVIAYMLPMGRNAKWLTIAFLVGAAVLNFTRSGLVTLAVFTAVLLYVDMRSNGLKFRHVLFALGGLAGIGVVAADAIIQLTREEALNIDQVSTSVVVKQLTGRAEIWSRTFDFIGKNLFFGNFSQRYRVLEGAYTGQYAHSSFLDLIATHGLFLAAAMAGFYIGRIRKRPVVLILLAPILFDSLFHEHIFWYISIIDIFVLYLLITREPSPAWRNPWMTTPSRPHRASSAGLRPQLS